jgi:putative inorganic carbon (HCO3(-)) transporter
MYKVSCFIVIIFIFALRLWIWKLFPGVESGIKNDLSDMIIASLIFGLAFFFFAHKAARREGLLKSGLEGPLALFIAAATVSLAWTTDMSSSVKALVMLLAYVFVFYMLLQSLSVEYQRRIFLWIFFLGSVVVAGYGINDIIVLSRVSPAELESARLTNKSLYYILTHKRACSLFGWPNVLAGFLMLSMPLTAALFVSVKSWWLKGVAVLGGMMMVAAFFLTLSFLGWSGLLVTAGVLSGVLIHRRILIVPPMVVKYLMVGAVLAAVLFTGVIMRKDFKESMTPRKEYARVVHLAISEHPVLGTGFGAYRFSTMKFVTSNEGETAFAHNTYAQVWAETGLPGLAAILWLMAIIFLSAQRILKRIGDGKDKMIFIAVLIGLAAFLVDNINSFTMLKPNASFFFWVWLALFCSYGLDQREVLPSLARFRRGMMIVLACVAAAGFFLSMRQVLSLSALRTGQEASRAGIFALAEEHFKRAHVLDPLNPGPLTAQGDLYLRAFRATSQTAWLDAAERLFLQSTVLAPNNHYNYLALASIYSSRGDRIKVDALIARARAVSPYETQRDLQVFSRQK